MTNAEKFKTAKERREAYHKHLSVDSSITDEFLWLELKYTGELKKCPFCGGEAKLHERYVSGSKLNIIECQHCFNRTASFSEKGEVIAAWNRRVK